MIYKREGLNLMYIWTLLLRASTEIEMRANDDAGLRQFAGELSGAAEVVLEIVHNEREN